MSPGLGTGRAEAGGPRAHPAGERGSCPAVLAPRTALGTQIILHTAVVISLVICASIAPLCRSSVPCQQQRWLRAAGGAAVPAEGEDAIREFAVFLEKI